MTSVERLRQILQNIQTILKTSPEKAALVSLDTAMVSLMSLLGMVGKLGESADNEMKCLATQMATEDLIEMESFLDFDIQCKSRFSKA